MYTLPEPVLLREHSDITNIKQVKIRKKKRSKRQKTLEKEVHTKANTKTTHEQQKSKT